MDEDNESEEEVEFLPEHAISLHAITSVTNSQTKQVKAKVTGILVLILIESGSTSSFVSPTLAAHLTAFLEGKKGFSVIVANGEQGAPGCPDRLSLQWVNGHPRLICLFSV